MNAYVYLNAKAIHPPGGETTGRPTDFETHPHGASTRMYARHLKADAAAAPLRPDSLGIGPISD